MNVPHVRLSLRYRPGPDVLTGVVELDTVAAPDVMRHDAPDADTSITWAHTGRATDVLSAFQVLHAASRWGAGAPAPLPAALGPMAAALIVEGAHALTAEPTTLDRVRCEVRLDQDVPLGALTRTPAERV